MQLILGTDFKEPTRQERVFRYLEQAYENDPSGGGRNPWRFNNFIKSALMLFAALAA